MSSIVKSTKSNSVSTSKAPVGTQTKNGDYTGGNVKHWEDYAPLREISVEEPTNALYTPYTSKKNGQFIQKVDGWASTATHIHVFTLIRPLKQLENKKMKPAGDWAFGDHEEHKIQNAPKMRKGEVSNSYAQTQKNSTASTSTSSSGPVSTPTKVSDITSSKPAEYQTQMAFDILPDQVRTPLYNMVKNNGSTILGQSLGFPDEEGRIQKEQSNLLVINDSKAVTVTAVREHKVKGKTPEQARESLYSVPWTVTQITYELGEDKTAISQNKRKGITG